MMHNLGQLGAAGRAKVPDDARVMASGHDSEVRQPTNSVKVMVCFGTRPELIKLAPVIRGLEQSPGVDPVVVASAQHREMLDQMLENFGLVPDVDLDLMRPNQTLAYLTGAAVSAFGRVYERMTPAAILVQGDTTTAMCAALAAFYAGIPLAHVEAGLRTNDVRSPFPEELNRRFISTVATWHFCATPLAAENLRREGIAVRHTEVTGNTVIDTLLWTVARQRQSGYTPAHLPQQRRPKRILVTLHRRETQGPTQRALSRALARVSRAHPDAEIVFPIHPSPSVRAAVLPELTDVEAVHLIEPVDYDDFVYLMSTAYVVVTDSGGIQEEAPSLDLPVLVLRDRTERPEGIEAGCARLCGTNPDRLREELGRLLTDPSAHRAMSSAANPYGDGRAAARIVEHLTRELVEVTAK